MPELQKDYVVRIREWFDRAEKLSEEMKNCDAGLFCKQPEADKWSAAQNFAHMNKALEEYSTCFEEGLSKAEVSQNTSSPGETVISHGLFGKFLFMALNPEKSMKVPAPKKFHGASDCGLEQIDLFQSKLEELRGFLSRAEKMNMAKGKMKNPVLPFLKLRFCDAFQIHAWHNVRHIEQAQRAIDKVGSQSVAA